MKKFISQLLKGALLGLFVASPLTFNTAKADDTEVYFLKEGLDNIPNPKVIIVVDFSSAGNGGQILQNFLAAIQALAADPTINENVDLGFAFMGKGPEVPIVYPAISATDAGANPSFTEVVNSITEDQLITGNTPTVQGMSEIARYFLGQPYKYANLSTTDSVPNTHPDAFLEGSITRYRGANDPSCGNAMVVIGTGQENASSWQDVDALVPNSYCNGKECEGSHLTRYLKELQNTVTYAIDAGASGQNAERLDNWAFYGGTGEAIDYDPTTDTTDCSQDSGLCRILRDIIEEVASQGSSFVQAGVTVSQQNRLNHDNHLYFAQFQASNLTRWPGNLKKYKIGSGNILDQNLEPAVDPNTGLFWEERNEFGEVIGGTSFWLKDINGVPTKVPDGNQVELGGSLEQLDIFLKTTEYTAGDGITYRVFDSYGRNLYTDMSGVMVPFSDSFPTKGDFAFTPEDPLEDDTEEFEKLKARTFGYNLRYVNTGDTTPVYDETTGEEIGQEPVIVKTATPARLFGDPLHSVPKVLRYNDSEVEADQTSLAFVGTNLGYLHAIDIATGKENWSYLPYDMLSKMQDYLSDEKMNETFDNHNYGLDGEIHIAHADTNNNLKVDSDETALLFVGMRRGGNRYYVIDISDPNEPVYKFKITGGEGRLSKLSDTWSGISVANINYKGGIKTVAIFGGGYDYGQDVEGTASAKDSVGNDVFIYDIAGQTVLWNLQDDTGVNTTEPENNIATVKELLNSVPANIRGISIDNDSTIDHLYVADTRGQVFRFDLYGTEDGLEVRAGRIFNGGGTDSDTGAVLTAADNRRFYYAPSVAYIPRPNNKSFMAVAIGSGYRAHPLDEVIQDYFFMIKDTGVLQSPKTFKDVAFNTTDLVDVTANVAGDPTVEQKVMQDDKFGWFIKLDGEITYTNAEGVEVTEKFLGEKVIAEARILFGRIVFTTYVPTVDTSVLQCAPVIGSAKLYGVEISDGSSFFSDTTRTIDLVSEGIPPIFQLLYTSGASGTSDEAAFIGLVGNEVIDDEFTKALTQGYDGVIRVNWRKKPDDE